MRSDDFINEGSWKPVKGTLENVVIRGGHGVRQG